MTAILLATAWALLALHTRCQRRRAAAEETAIRRHAAHGIHQIETYLKEAADQ